MAAEFSVVEELILAEAAVRHGPTNARALAAALDGRTGGSCRSPESTAAKLAAMTTAVSLAELVLELRERRMAELRALIAQADEHDPPTAPVPPSPAVATPGAAPGRDDADRVRAQKARGAAARAALKNICAHKCAKQLRVAPVPPPPGVVFLAELKAKFDSGEMSSAAALGDALATLLDWAVSTHPSLEPQLAKMRAYATQELGPARDAEDVLINGRSSRGRGTAAPAPIASSTPTLAMRTPPPSQAERPAAAETAGNSGHGTAGTADAEDDGTRGPKRARVAV